jgi:hypothetical protein
MWANMIYVGERGLMMIYVGERGLMMIYVDECGLMMIYVGECGQIFPGTRAKGLAGAHFGKKNQITRKNKAVV